MPTAVQYLTQTVTMEQVSVLAMLDILQALAVQAALKLVSFVCVSFTLEILKNGICGTFKNIPLISIRSTGRDS